MTFISKRRTVAAIAAASCMAIPATAHADSDAAQLPGAQTAPAAKSTVPPAGFGGGGAQTAPAATSTVPTADFGGGGAQTAPAAKSTFPPADFGGGDNPADHPGMSRAQKYDGPSTIEVVRPERTIVRDVDEALPLILAGTALALVLASLGFALVRTRLVPRPGRSS